MTPCTVQYLVNISYRNVWNVSSVQPVNQMGINSCLGMLVTAHVLYTSIVLYSFGASTTKLFKFDYGILEMFKVGHSPNGRSARKD